MHPDDPQLVLVGGQGTSSTSNWSFALARTTNGGTGWQRTFVNQSVRGYCYALAVAPSGTDTIYAGGYVNAAGAVALSTDRGASWQQVAAPAETVFGLVVHPDDGAYAYAATTGGVYRTTDAGTTWNRLLNRRGLRAVRLYPGNPGTVFAAGDEGVWVSYDNGESWDEMNEGLAVRQVWCLEFAQVEPFSLAETRLFAGTTGGAAYAWSFMVGAQEPGPRAEVLRPSQTVVRGVLRAGHDWFPPGETGSCPKLVLLDASGRKVMDLQPGENNLQAVSPGVYYLRSAAGGEQTVARRAVILN